MESREYSLEEMPALAGDLIRRFGHIRVWVLEGMLGAGKTTLVQQIGLAKGISEDIVSPTFSLVNEYHTAEGEKVFHLDLYRLKNISETEEIGLQEIEESGYFCLVEWGSAVGYTPSVPWLEIRLEHLKQTRRKIRILLHEN
jgi:tRNA threonylcarbamoyladenosine biosynthesis protein TsaE